MEKRHTVIWIVVTLVGAIVSGIIPYALSRDTPRVADVIWSDDFSYVFPAKMIVEDKRLEAGYYTLETTSNLSTVVLRNVGTATAAETRLLLNGTAEKIQTNPPIEFVVEPRSGNSVAIVLLGIGASESVRLSLFSPDGLWVDRVTFDNKAAERVTSPALARREYSPGGLLVPYYVLFPVLVLSPLLIILLHSLFQRPTTVRS